MTMFKYLAILLGVTFSHIYLFSQAPNASFSPGDTTLCLGDSLTFVDQSTGNITSSFWIIRQTPDTIYEIQGAGPITVTFGQNSGVGNDTILRVVNGPMGTDTFIVVVQLNVIPSVNAGIDLEFCKDGPGVFLMGQVSGGTPPFTFHWSPASGLNDSSLFNPFARPEETTTYAFQVKAPDGGCPSNIDSVTIFVNPGPSILTQDVSYCLGQDSGVYLPALIDTQNNQAPLPFSYLWTPLDSLDDPNTLSPFSTAQTETTYTLTSFSINGCLSTDTVKVIPYDPPVLPDILDTAITLLDTLYLQTIDFLNPGVRIYWGPDSLLDSLAVGQIPIFIPGDTGYFDFQYEALDTLSNCVTTGGNFQVKVILPPVMRPLIVFSSMQDSIGIDPSTLDATATYNWWYTLMDGTLETSINDSALMLALDALRQSPENTGYVALQANRGQERISSEVVEIGLSTHIAPKQFEVELLRPSPAHEFVEVWIPSLATTQAIGLYDLKGRLLKNQTVNPSQKAQWVRLDLQGISPGIYIIYWRGKRFKMMKEK